MTEEKFREIINSKNLSELPFYLSKLDYKLFKLKQGGVSNSKDRRIKRLLLHRNFIRKRLLDLLLKWKESGFKSDPLDYNSVINKDMKQEQIDKSILDEDDEK